MTISFEDAVDAARSFLRSARFEEGYDAFDPARVDDAEARQLAEQVASPLSDFKKLNEKLSWPAFYDSAIKEAETDRFAFAVLRYVSAKYVEGGLAPPPPIRFWLRDYLNGEIIEPARPRGRPPGDYHHFIVRQAVRLLVDAGLQETRNDESRNKQTACDAVAKAMLQLRLAPNSYSKVKRIWMARSRDG